VCGLGRLVLLWLSFWVSGCVVFLCFSMTCCWWWMGATNLGLGVQVRGGCVVCLVFCGVAGQAILDLLLLV